MTFRQGKLRLDRVLDGRASGASLHLLSRAASRAIAAVRHRVVPAIRARSSLRFDLVRKPTADLAHYKKIIDLASAQAKIGVWECDLETTTLSWTDGVYALFELPPHSRVTRARAVTFYDPESRAEMETLRARAIRDRSGFSLDARITTAKGNRRWMRLTANVECENGVRCACSA